MIQKGEVFHVGTGITQRAIFDAGDAPHQIAKMRLENDRFKYSWQLVCLSAWRWLFEHKHDRIRVWGPVSFKYRRFRAIWERAFGTCPFSWKDGPDA